MKYGRKSVRRRSDTIYNNRSRALKKILFQTTKVLLIGLITVLICGVGVGGVYIGRLISSLPDIEDIDITPSGYSTTITDKDGNEIEQLAGAGANRRYVKLDKIPENLQNAFVSVEDERFYEHGGIDFRGILRAGIVGILGGGDFSQGASTITQQLLKNNFFINWTQEKNFKSRMSRKIQEQYLATELEKEMSKNDIMENYLNTINLGAGTLGVQAASERYFNKNVEDLNLSECAVIAGITKNPTKYNPIENPDENASRRLLVLNNMLEQGFITEKEYNEAVEDDVYDRIEAASSKTQKLPTTYFTDALINQVIEDLVEQKGYTQTEAWQLLYSGGLEIQSTQDRRIQRICDEEVENNENYTEKPKYSFFYRLTVEHGDGTFETFSEQTMLSYYREKDPSYSINFKSEKDALKAVEKYKKAILKSDDKIVGDGEKIVYTLQPQVAMTVIDQRTGAVSALIGGRGMKTASRTLNRATDTTRQPGSTFKILAAFAPALDAGGQTLASVQDDAPYNYSDGTLVKNYDKKYRGYTTIREAITDSINIVTVKTLSEIGTGMGFEYVKDFGITTLETGDNTQSLALGGITKGVKNIELTAAYASIANGGTYHEPKFYIRILDHDGNELLNARKDEATRQVINDTTAWLLTDAMKDVMTKGTGKAANFTSGSDKEMAVAGKSGTTTHNRDAVFVGYTPYYTCGIWGRFDDNSPQKSGKYGYAKKIWKQVMKRANETKEVKDFTRPPGILELRVCKKSGKLPLKYVCNHDPRGNMIYKEYFARDTQPQSSCDHHTSVTLCKESGLPISEFCPEEDRHTGVYIVGGSGADKKYSLSQETLSQTCNIHTSDEEDTEKVKEKEKDKDKDKEKVDKQ